MDAAGLAGKLHGFQTTLTSLIRHLQRPYAFREDDEIELKHFIKNIDRAINNIKDVVEGATGPVQMVDECPIVPGPTSSGDGASVMPADVTPVAPIVIEPKQLSQDTPLHDADMTTTAMESVVISHVQSISEDVKPEQTSAAVAAPHVSPSMEDVTCTHVTPKQDVPQTPTLNTSSTSISPTQNLSFTQNTPGTSFTQDAAGTSVTLECTSIHIGSLKGEAEFRLTLSTSGVDISLTGAMGDRIDFHIGCEELVKIKSHLLDAPRVIFIYTSPECGERIRQLCNMTDTSGTNYDPLSKVDSERRITVMLEPLTDQVIRTVGTVCWRMEDHPEAPCMLHKKIGTQQASNMLGISTPQRSKPEPRRSDIPASTPQCNTEPPQVEAPKEEPKAGRPVRKSAAAASATWKPLVRNRDSTDSNKTVELDDDDLPDIIGETPTRTSPADKDDPDFGDEDFDESVLQQINAAEKSILEDDLDLEEEDVEHQPDDKKYLVVLKQYFGYRKFRPLQWKIINSVLNERRDNCVIMATGYGKSLCYQYPSVYTGGTSFVISPLISLMEDQVLALSAANIKACFLGTAQTAQSTVIAGIKRKEYRVVYITPEFAEAASGLLKEIHKSIGIDLVAVDEAHCVSQWGHDFRAAYRSLGNLRSFLSDVPFLAMTATATPPVVKDISRSLGLKNPLYTCTGFDRPNLFLSVKLKSGDIIKDLRSLMSASNGRQEFEGATIIYCPTKKATEEVLNCVKILGVQCALYHAGMPLSERKKSHQMFINDKVQVVVATVAFGMGIDKPDVRQIIHYGAPKDIESYYQEIGRAGRDGNPSACHVFYQRSDFNTSRYFLKDISNQKHLEHKQNMLSKMEAYLGTTACRRKCILSHFESKDLDGIGGSQKCCDNCFRRLSLTPRRPTSTPKKKKKRVDRTARGDSESPPDNKKDYGPEAIQLLRAIEITGERFGITVPIYFIRGSNNQRLPQKYCRYSEYGKGKHKTEKWWKAFAHQLTSEGYLKEVSVQGGYGCTVELTKKAKSWKSRSSSLNMIPNEELQAQEQAKVDVSILGAPVKILPLVPANIWHTTREAESSAVAVQPRQLDPKEEALQRTLYSKLIVLRNEMSQARGIPTFVLVTNKSLLDMAKTRPTTMENLLKVEEIAEEKAQRYGKEFLEFISKFCTENQMEADVMPAEVEVMARMDAKLESAFMSLGVTVQSTYQMFERQKMSLDRVASIRGLKPSTLSNHLSEAIKVGLPVDLDRLGLTEQIRKLITDVVRAPPINSDISRLTPIKEQLPEHIDFSMIKLTLAVLQRQFGVSGVVLDPAADIDISAVAAAACAAVTATPPPSQSQTWRSPPGSSASFPPSQYSASQSSSQSSSGQKRKLPGWMATSSHGAKKASLTKKMKKNSLFK